jgi:hypothetical protein
MRRYVVLAVLFLGGTAAWCSVDTLKDTSDIYDTYIYSWVSCNQEIFNENCLRFNAGAVVNATVGKIAGLNETRMLLSLPGWDGVVPDSAVLRVYCSYEKDALVRRIMAYPLTRAFSEGSENDYNTGTYPDPDSGATWLHAYLDDGDDDSVLWTNPGGDYTTAIACTTTIAGTGEYFSFDHFRRLLNYFDTSGSNYGFILVNENAMPSVSSGKVLRSSEGPGSTVPLLILHEYEPSSLPMRRGRVIKRGSVGQ